MDKSGQVDKLAALHDLAEVQAVTEDDLRTAIEELRQSTEAISRQSETLRQQHDALSRLESKQAETSARRRTLEASRRSKSDSERKRVAAEVTFFLNSHKQIVRPSQIRRWLTLCPPYRWRNPRTASRFAFRTLKIKERRLGRT